MRGTELYWLLLKAKVSRRAATGRQRGCVRPSKARFSYVFRPVSGSDRRSELLCEQQRVISRVAIFRRQRRPGALQIVPEILPLLRIVSAIERQGFGFQRVRQLIGTT